jgi:hypothetical protein
MDGVLRTKAWPGPRLERLFEKACGVPGSLISTAIAGFIGLSVFLLPPAAKAQPAASQVTGIAVQFHDGQTFITWRDAAQGAEDTGLRYSLYRSTQPITDQNLANAQLVAAGIMYNSAKLFSANFAQKDRINPATPSMTVSEGTAPLPMWSGLAVYTARRPESAYYAVAATDLSLHRVDKIIPGESASNLAVTEAPAPIQPIRMQKAVGHPNGISTAPDQPLTLKLHASDATGGEGNPNPWHGDYYVYFGTEEMGWREGLPGAFSVEDEAYLGTRGLEIFPRDTILKPDGSAILETYWFGYYGSPEWAADRSPHAYPFTETRLLWMVNWAVAHYRSDPNRVYATGVSMGGWGSTTFALRHPEIFAAIYAMMPRPRQRGLPTLVPRNPQAPATMPDGQDYFQRMDMVNYVTSSKDDLPFYAWSIGRHDSFAPWKDQVDFVRALEKAHRGFAFAWNDGGHGDGTQPMATLLKYYPPTKFARNLSYPAFSNSSLDNNPGSGQPEEGDKEGGINLGFRWSALADTNGQWQVDLSNDLAKAEMTVDVTPRRLQAFKLRPGETAAWHTSSGGSGKAEVDATGALTIPAVKIEPGSATTLVISPAA